MAYSFDSVIDRRHTNSMKWDFASAYGSPDDALPLWLADMDFQAPQAVREAVRQTAAHGIFGYTMIKPDYFDAVHGWFLTRHAYAPKSEAMITTPGVVAALAAAVQAFCEKGDAVLIQPPVYGPFSAIVEANGRALTLNPLVQSGNRYEMDFDDLEKKLGDPRVKLMILCSPHNPVCRVWTRGELMRVGELCLKHRVVLVSDEIHCDFIFSGHKHTISAALNEEIADNCILCTAPSKTFNIAGLQVSNIFISNADYRRRMHRVLAAAGYDSPTICGYAAAKAAYLHGADWLDALLPYLEQNARMVTDFIRTRIPNIQVTDTDGTFLMWLDFRALGLGHEEVNSLLLHRAKLWLDSGLKFGLEGEGFFRLNIGCPRAVLEGALERLAEAVAQ